jgi:hypothetical protein
VQVHVGRAGHWLRVWGTNTLASRELRSLVEQGLRAIATDRDGKGAARPVYATVRDYEAGLSSVLTGFGFAPYASRARFVKHTTATVRRPVTSAVAAREVRQEVPVRTQPLPNRRASSHLTRRSAPAPAWNPIQE